MTENSEMEAWIKAGEPEPVAARELAEDEERDCAYDCEDAADYLVEFEYRSGDLDAVPVCQSCSRTNRIYARGNDLLDHPVMGGER